MTKYSAICVTYDLFDLIFLQLYDVELSYSSHKSLIVDKVINNIFVSTEMLKDDTDI